MVTRFIASIGPHVSTERLESYRPLDPVPGTDRAMLVNYLYNLALCEAMYTSLSLVEIGLRNSLHASLTSVYGSTGWYDQPGTLRPNQAADVVAVRGRIGERGHPVTPGRVVAGLPFGFWVSLLSRDYQALWQTNARLLRSCFPHHPKPFRQRRWVYHRFNSIRELRNRAFHHEPIWSRHTLREDHAYVVEAIGWISPDMVTACELMDRFPDVRRDGKTVLERMLAQRFPGT